MVIESWWTNGVNVVLTFYITLIIIHSSCPCGPIFTNSNAAIKVWSTLISINNIAKNYFLFMLKFTSTSVSLSGGNMLNHVKPVLEDVTNLTIRSQNLRDISNSSRLLFRRFTEISGRCFPYIYSRNSWLIYTPKKDLVKYSL